MKSKKNTARATTNGKRAVQGLLLAGMLVAYGAGVAGAADSTWSDAVPNWGDLTFSADQATTGSSVWRDGKFDYPQQNNGDVTLNAATLTINGATTIGNGSLFLNTTDTKGALTVNNALWISQGNLNLTGAGAIDLTGAGALTLATGNVSSDGIFTTAGSSTVDIAGGLTAKNLKLESTGTFFADSVTATGAASTINSNTGVITVTGAVNMTGQNLTITDIEDGSSFGSLNVAALDIAKVSTGSNNRLTITEDIIATGAVKIGSADKAEVIVGGNFTATGQTVTIGRSAATAADSELFVGGNFTAGAVTIDGASNSNALILGGVLGTRTEEGFAGEHSATSVNVTMGSLVLTGADEVLNADGTVKNGAISQTLTAPITLSGVGAADAYVISDGGVNTVGNVSVTTNTNGNLYATANSTLNVGTITVAGNTGNAGTDFLKIGTGNTGTVAADGLNLVLGSATIDGGVFKIASSDIAFGTGTKLNVANTNGATLHLTDAAYSHALGAQTAGLVMNGGTLWMDGTLSLTANTAANTQAINTGSASAVDTLKGNIVTKKLTTNSTNTNGVTITAGSVQILGDGTTADMYTTAVSTGNHSLTVTDGNGTLTLGATAAYNNGNAEGTLYGGKVNTIVLSAPGSNLVFGHGNTTVTTLAAGTNGALVFNDDTGFGGTNTLNLNGTGAFDAMSVELGEGAFSVNGTDGIEMVTNGTTTIKLGANGVGSLNKLTLGDKGTGSGLVTTGNDATGVYTITNLIIGNAAAEVEVDDGKLITTTLDMNNITLTGNLKTSGTGIWQIGDIVSTGGAKAAKFELADTSSLIIGQNVTLGNGSFNIKSETGVDHTITDVTGTTFGSTGTLTIGTTGNLFTVGATASDDSTKLNLIASTLNLAGTPGALNIGGADGVGTVTIQGAGNTSVISNATKIQIGGSNTNDGTLNLGGDTLGTGNFGGVYAGEILVGDAATNGKNGTLTFNGGNFNLQKVTLSTANGSSTVTLAAGSGILNMNYQNPSFGGTIGGLVLDAGAGAIANNTLNIGNSDTANTNTDYTITGGVKVIKGEVNFGTGNPDAAANENYLNNAIVMNGSAVGDAVINVDGGINTVNSLTATNATTATGTLNMKGGSLTVAEGLDLSKALVSFSTIPSTLSTGDKDMVLGKITTGATAAGNTNLWTGESILEAKNLAVKDVAGVSTTADVAAGQTLTLAIGGGAVTASDLNVAGTVNLFGKGGNIALTAPSVPVPSTNDGILDVTGTLNVGQQAVTDTTAPENDKASITSDWTAGKVKVTNGTVDVIGGSLGIAELNTNTGSTLNVGKVLDTTSIADTTNYASTGHLNIASATFAAGTNNLTVENGTVLFGSATSNAAFTSAFNSSGAMAGLGVVNAPIDLSTVTGIFGTSVQNSTVLGTNDIEFGADSLTYINGNVKTADGKKDIYQDVAAGSELLVDITATGTDTFAITTGGDVFVDTGAQLYLDAAKAGRYLLVNVPATPDTSFVAGMWNEDHLSTNRLFDFNLKTTTDHKQVYADLSVADMTKNFPGMTSSLGGIFTALARDGQYDTESANYGIRFLSRVADRGTYLPTTANDRLAAVTAEGAARMAAAGAVPTMTYGASSAVTDVVMQRTSLVAPLTQGTAIAMTDEGLTLDANQGLSAGSMTPGFGLWAMPLYQNLRAKDLSAGNMQTGFKSDLYGMAIGADYTLPNNLRLGATFNVGAGESDSTGDFNRTQNDFDFVGLGLYAGWATGNFGLSADLAYTWSNNDVKQDLPASMQMASLKGDVDSSALSFGLRAEYKFTPAAGVDVVPHAGIRYTHLNSDSYNVKSAGNTVMHADSVTQNLVSFPLGVALSKDFNTSNGWLVKPQLDLGMTFTAGDIDFEQNVNVPGVNATARMDTRVLDRYTFDAGLGLSTEKNGVSFGLAYDLKIGKDTTSHGVNAMLRYKF